MPDVALRIRDLTAGYGPVPTIMDISIRAKASQVTALVGLNGAGKSTVLKAVAGVIKSTGGEVQLAGENVLNRSPEKLLRLGISYVPQVDNVFPSLTVRENLEMGGYILRSGVAEKISEVIDLFPDLKDAMGRPARTLSGGQRIMLAVARGLMVQPSVLLLDEPTAGLAPRFESAVWARIMAVRATGVALVVVDQNVRRALSNADWGYVLAMGRNHAEGPGLELLESGDLKSLLGTERMTFNAART
jgi:ABC-type branched-subunit amino acid transport system ATPase component